MPYSVTQFTDAVAMRPATMLVAGRAIGFAAAFAIPLVLVRVFDTAEFGTYKQLFLIYGTLFGIAQLGMAESLYYFVPAHRASAGAQVANALAVLGATGIVVFGLLMLARDDLAAWLGNPRLDEYIPLIAAALAVMLLTAVLEITMVSRKRYLTAAVTYASSDIVRAGVIIAAALVFGQLWWVVLAAVVFALARLAALAWAVWREFDGTLRLDLPAARAQLAYALPFALAVGIEVAQANLHQYVVAARYDTAVFAIYAVGCLQIPLVDLMATSAANVMMVKMAAGAGDGHGRAALSMWHDTICRLALVVFPVTAFLVIAAREVIVLLFTDAYAASVPIFMLWTLMSLPAVLCVDAVLRARAATRTLLWMNVLRFVLVLGLIGWSLSVFGLPGAVIVTLAATVVARVVGLVTIARLMHVSFVEVLPWRRLAALLACAIGPAVFVWYAAAALAASPAVTLVVGGLLYALLYALAWLAYTYRGQAGPVFALARARRLPTSLVEP